MKCETSVGFTDEAVGEVEDVVCGRNWFCTNGGAVRRRRVRLRSEVGPSGEVVMALDISETNSGEKRGAGGL